MTNNHPMIVPMQSATSPSAKCIDSSRMVRHRHGISPSLSCVWRAVRCLIASPHHDQNVARRGADARGADAGVGTWTSR